MSKSVSIFVLNNFVNDSRVQKVALSFKNMQNSVTVVAMHEATLKEYDEYEGIPVHRISICLRKMSRLFHPFKYFEFIYKAGLRYRKSDIYYCNDLLTLPIGVLFKFFFNWRGKIIYDSHEFAPNDHAGQSRKSILLKYLLEFLFIRFANETIAVSDSIADEYQRIYRIQRPHVIFNSPYLKNNKKSSILRDKLGLPEDIKIFLYLGALTEGRGINLLLNSFERVSSDKCALVFIGFGGFESKIKEVALKNNLVFFLPAVPQGEIIDYASSADIGLCLIEPVCKSYELCLPNKLFEYAMARIPIMFSPLVEMKRIITKYPIGVVLKELNEENIVECVEHLLSTKPEGYDEGIERFLLEYNWEKQDQKLRQIVQNI